MQASALRDFRAPVSPIHTSHFFFTRAAAFLSARADPRWLPEAMFSAAYGTPLSYRAALPGEQPDEFAMAAEALAPEPLLPNPMERCDGADQFIKMLHGTTTLAFKYKGGVVVAVDSRASSGAYIASQTVKKVIEINPFLLGTMAGGAADCSYWERYLGMRCRLFELDHKERISVAGASKILSNITYQYKNYGLSMGTMICGWDKTGPQIFYVDSDGQRCPGKLFSVGSGSTFAYGVLDTGYKYDLTSDQAFDLAEKAIFAATHRDAYSGGTVRIYHITETGWERIRETDSMELYFRFQAEGKYNPK